MTRPKLTGGSVQVMVAAMHLPVWEMLAMYHIDIPLQALLSFMWFRRRPVTSQVRRRGLGLALGFDSHCLGILVA